MVTSTGGVVPARRHVKERVTAKNVVGRIEVASFIEMHNGWDD
jgi:hypothetical protein